MSSLLDSPLVDLVDYGKSHKRVPTGKRFATHIAGLANAVVRRHVDQKELAGIQRCLKYELQVLQWRTYFWKVPLSTWQYADGSFANEGRDGILPNSLTATVLLYRNQLNEHHSGLSRLVFSDLVNGLEWACHASIHQSKPEESRGVMLIEPTSVRSYVNAPSC